MFILTPYYPQCNGLVEKINGVLCKIITKHVRNRPQDWDKHLTAALWAYRTSFKASTQFTPYHLVYGQEALLPIEVQLGSLRVLARETTSSKEKLEQRILDLQRLELDREAATDYYITQANKKREQFNNKVKEKKLEEGMLVMKYDSSQAVGCKMKSSARGLSRHKTTGKGTMSDSRLELQDQTPPTNQLMTQSTPSKVEHWSTRGYQNFSSWLHEEYGLSLKGKLPKELSDKDIPDEEWLSVFKCLHKKNSKLFLNHVKDEFVECRILYQKVYQATPSNGELLAKFARGFVYERCPTAASDSIGHWIAWARELDQLNKELEVLKTSLDSDPREVDRKEVEAVVKSGDIVEDPDAEPFVVENHGKETIGHDSSKLSTDNQEGSLETADKVEDAEDVETLLIIADTLRKKRKRQQEEGVHHPDPKKRRARNCWPKETKQPSIPTRRSPKSKSPLQDDDDADYDVADDGDADDDDAEEQDKVGQTRKRKQPSTPTRRSPRTKSPSVVEPESMSPPLSKHAKSKKTPSKEPTPAASRKSSMDRKTPSKEPTTAPTRKSPRKLF
ncbi:hypothetical protein L7F22_060900 [Adiantum nelumboides]|nr:hypothetical protein [Adiantum nelumboides]